MKTSKVTAAAAIILFGWTQAGRADADSDMVKLVQGGLAAEGYAIEEINGICGDGTAEAIKAYLAKEDILKDLEAEDLSTTKAICDGVGLGATYMHIEEKHGADLAKKLGIPVLTAADVAVVEERCNAKFEFMDRFVGSIRSTAGPFILGNIDWFKESAATPEDAAKIESELRCYADQVEKLQ